MIFFQCALLAGYAGAYGLLRLDFKLQRWLFLAAALLAVISLRLPPDARGAGLSGPFLSLAASTLPAMLLLFSTSIVLHGWLHRHSAEVPYYLYAISNVGSLIGLVGYPFIIEPYIGLQAQSLYWHGGLLLLAGILVCLAIYLGRHPGRDPQADTPAAISEAPTTQRTVAWLLLSALPCMTMLGATHLLSAEIGSNPLSWVLPFGIYLASFAGAFSGWWGKRCQTLAIGALIIGMTAFWLSKGIGAAPLSGSLNAWLLLALAGACFSAHGWVYELKPTSDFGKFYITLAAGGAIGGVFTNFLAPNLFDRSVEFLLGATLLATALLFRLGAAGWRERVLIVLPVLCLAAGQILTQVNAENTDTLKVHRLRNVYGGLSILIAPGYIQLSHETTLHGRQMNAREEDRRKPTAYYTESSVSGVLIRDLQSRRAALNIGVVGLGAGTLAAYGRAEDEFHFWDIDPKVIWIASTVFSFTKDSPARIHLHEADGRKGVENASVNFDLMIVDAFSGDAVPPHLLTVEALSIYHKSVSAKGGVVALHISNRYARLLPIVAASAERLGLEALYVCLETVNPNAGQDTFARPNEYIVLHRPDQREQVDALFPVTNAAKSIHRLLTRLTPEELSQSRGWTDDRHATTDALNLRAVLGW